ncbi:peritrophin-1-like, partial [Limulus polyphemus]|uniref:Peritrophin-1-like n=1 Tax=Limulus polyphemus TaxID=6850 RepID=A0ABM1C490_LIMPO
NECPCDCCAIPDPKDCSKFTLCINGNAIKQTCADGLRFNPKIENCDYARNVECDPPCDKDCDGITTPPPGIHCKTPSGLFPHPTKCNLFIHCSHNIPHVKECPSILHFNPTLRVCDWPWNAGCGKPCDDIDTPEGECDCDCCIKPVPGDCAAYIRCENYQKYHGRCTGGLLFNPKIENCDFPENVDCDDKPVPGCKCESESGLFPHPHDCTKFIHCAHWKSH